MARRSRWSLVLAVILSVLALGLLGFGTLAAINQVQHYTLAQRGLDDVHREVSAMKEPLDEKSEKRVDALYKKQRALLSLKYESRDSLVWALVIFAGGVLCGAAAAVTFLLGRKRPVPRRATF